MGPIAGQVFSLIKRQAALELGKAIAPLGSDGDLARRGCRRQRLA